MEPGGFPFGFERGSTEGVRLFNGRVVFEPLALRPQIVLFAFVHM